MVTWYKPVDLPLCISFASAVRISPGWTGFKKLIEVSSATESMFLLLHAKAKAESDKENATPP